VFGRFLHLPPVIWRLYLFSSTFGRTSSSLSFSFLPSQSHPLSLHIHGLRDKSSSLRQPRILPRFPIFPFFRRRFLGLACVLGGSTVRCNTCLFTFQISIRALFSVKSTIRHGAHNMAVDSLLSLFVMNRAVVPFFIPHPHAALFACCSFSFLFIIVVSILALLFLAVHTNIFD